MENKVNSGRTYEKVNIVNKESFLLMRHFLVDDAGLEGTKWRRQATSPARGLGPRGASRATTTQPSVAAHGVSLRSRNVGSRLRMRMPWCSLPLEMENVEA